LAFGGHIAELHLLRVTPATTKIGLRGEDALASRAERGCHERILGIRSVRRSINRRSADIAGVAR